MCGIAGVLSFSDSKVNVSDLKIMTDEISHRGPDGEGHWINEKGNVGLGHRRLSIIDLSNAGAQPMHAADGNYIITFNGEIYNYLEIKKMLIHEGYSFKSESDTEVIMSLYDLKKEKCLNDLDGMFAFAIWDKREQKLFCARDRFGEKPFYFYKDSQKLVFASEMKSLWAYGIKKTPRRNRIFQYLLYSNVEDPQDLSSTFYENIYQLKPSHYFDNAIKETNITQHQYWELSTETNHHISYEEAKLKFKTLFLDSIKLRLRSDVAVGSSLSGGLDSSAIVCSIHDYFQEERHSFQTFSAVFPGFEKDESPYIDIITDKTGIKSNRVEASSDSFLKNLDKINYHQEEPYGSASISAQYEVMELAKKNNVSVLLDGQGADEILAGYKKVWGIFLKQLFVSNPKKHKIEKALFKSRHDYQIEETTKLHYPKLLFYKTFMKAGNYKRSLTSSHSSFFKGIHPGLVDQFKKDNNPLYTPPNVKEHLKFLLTGRGINELLRYSDRNSMAHSVEVRLPFLSHKLVEFLLSLPVDFLISNGWSKRILRDSMDGILPERIQWRKDKIGFEPPQKDWFKNEVMANKLHESIKFMKHNEIIEKVDESMRWKYLMIGTFLNSTTNH